MIFDLEDNVPKITIEGIHIPEFRAIWEADKSEDKEIASQILPYIYHMVSPKSSYSQMNMKEREEVVKADYIKNKKWEPDELVKKAMDKYTKLISTPSLRLVLAAEGAADKLSDYYNQLDFSERDHSGKLIYSANDLSNTLAKVSSIVTSLQELRKKVEKEQVEGKTSRRGGVQPSRIL